MGGVGCGLSALLLVSHLAFKEEVQLSNRHLFIQFSRQEVVHFSRSIQSPHRHDSGTRPARIRPFGVAGSAKLTQSLDSAGVKRRMSNQEHAMIKVSVMYPNTPGARFDHEYYRDKHMPLLKARMGDACKSYTVDKGVAGGAPGAPATYVGMCHIFCDSIEAFQAGFGPHAKEIMADIPNYTDQAPVIQISEVVVG
jgi:uncharacterized protein (TIGR02118 family)